jgi:2-hydroxy-6-oxonona-2,4-dienedioate hydrolase
MGKRAPLVTAAFLAMAALALVWAQYREDLGHARVRVSTGTVVQTACGPVEYASEGSGPPVLVVHGAGGGFDQGLDMVGALARSGFRVIAVSRFGYLRTPLPADASAQAQADAHACLLDSLGIARAAVVGGSAGAPSSLQLAIRHPQRVAALVLLVPAAYAPREGGAPSVETPAGTPLLFDTVLRSDFLMWMATHMMRGTLVPGILGTPAQLLRDAAPEERARVDRALDLILPVTARRAGLLNDAAITSSLRRYELERIAAPTLLVSFRDDLYGTLAIARSIASGITGARLVAFPTGGHLGVGHEAEVNAELLHFLEGAMPAARPEGIARKAP